MARERPRIRYDGVYVCKMHYVKYGWSEVSEYRPSFDVYSYKYLRFYPKGNCVAVYTTQTPKKFLSKFYSEELDLSST